MKNSDATQVKQVSNSQQEKLSFFTKGLPFVRLAQSEWVKSFVIGVLSSLTASLILTVLMNPVC